MSKIRQVIVHIADNADLSALDDRMSQYHVEIIARRLKQSDLSVTQKIEVIDRIAENFRGRE